uniref:Cyclic nucleotide-binding domain-containing protein n=1 Tax=Phaeomonas parva TaxID=124430 RepID=A0A7S1UCC9_9STRA|mmetsp:Transcript_38587/g.120826  ORF Transcript_38587/g.120826 Transcript_38587/m.120826 type:complete len:1377 (+) Transcript_38587:206-4336(+)
MIGRATKIMKGAAGAAIHPRTSKGAADRGRKSGRFSVSVRKHQITPEISVPDVGSLMHGEGHDMPDWCKPHSTFRTAWDSLMFVIVTYNMIVTPIHIAIIKEEEASDSPLVVLDILLDLLFVADTVLRFNFAYIDAESKIMVTSDAAIRQHYLHSPDFVINCVACSPLFFNLLDISGVNLGAGRKMFNLPRLIRVLNYRRQFQQLEDYLEGKGYMVNQAVLRLSKILFFALLMNNLAACLYFAVSCPGEYCNEQGTWAAEDPVMSHYNAAYNETVKPDAGEVYARSVYYMIQTLFAIGYGDSVIPQSTSEIILACCFILGGTFLYALLIAGMASVLANIDVLQMRFRSEMDLLNQYMEFRDIPEGLRDRIKSFFDYIFQKQYGMLEEHIMNELPPHLFREVCKTRVAFLEKIPFWNPEYRSAEFLVATAKALRPLTYAPGSIIIYHREKQRELTIVRSGEVQVYIKEKEQPLSKLLPGDYVGDFQLLFGKLHPVGLRASSKSFCETLMLSLTSLMDILNLPGNREIQRASLDAWNSNEPGMVATVEAYRKELVNYKKLFDSQNQKSNKLKNMMDDNDVINHGKVIEPDSSFHIYWDTLLIVCTLYGALAIPGRLTALVGNGETIEESNLWDWSLIVDYLFEFVYIGEMVLQGYFFAFHDIDSDRDDIIYDHEAIRDKYVKSARFKFDVLTIFPFEVIGFGVGGKWSLLRVPKMLRTVGLTYYVNDLKSHLEVVNQIVVSAASMMVVQMLFATIILIHWSSCGWSLVFYEGEDYPKSLYWAFTTFTTVGYGDISPDDIKTTIFAIIVGSVGAIFCAAIIANVTSFVHDVDVSSENAEHRKNSLRWFMGEQGISNDLQERVMGYFNYLEHETSGVDENKLLDYHLPLNLQQDVRVCITNDLVLNCDLFKDCSSGFLRMLMLSLTQRLYMRGSWMISKEQPAAGMFFVKSGMVELLVPGGGVTAKISHGATFAEWAVTNDAAGAILHARAATDCEVWFLSRHTFRDLLYSFPRERQFTQQMDALSQSKARKQGVAGIKTEDAAALAKLQKAFYVTTDSKPYAAWNMLVLTVLMWNLMAVPFRMAFFGDMDSLDASVAIDYVGDLIFLLDVVLRARYLAFQEDDVVVTKTSRIMKHYLGSRSFVWHAIAVPPIELLALAGGTNDMSITQWFAILRVTKLARVADLMTMIALAQKHAAQFGLKINKNALQVWRLMSLIFICAHWFGCIFFLLAFHSDKEGDPNNWAARACVLDTDETADCSDTDQSIVSQYIHALYWATATVSTVGYGDISAVSDPEVFFSICILIVGTLIFTLCIANLKDIVTQEDVTASLYNNKTDQVNVFVANQGMPDDLQDRVQKYYSVLPTLNPKPEPEPEPEPKS